MLHARDVPCALSLISKFLLHANSTSMLIALYLNMHIYKGADHMGTYTHEITDYPNFKKYNYPSPLPFSTPILRISNIKMMNFIC